MKTVIYLIIILLIAFLGSCNKNVKTLKFVPKDTVVIELPDSISRDVYFYNLFKRNDTTYFLCYFNYVPYLYLFNLEAKTFIKKIPIYKYFSNGLGFQYINNDSIWIFGGTTVRYNTDSSLMVINDRGEIKHIYRFDHPKAINTKNFPLFLPAMDTFSSNAFDTCIFYDINCVYENMIINDRIFFKFGYSEKVRQNINENKGQYPLYAYFDLKTKKMFYNNNLWFPYTPYNYTSYYGYTFIEPYNFIVSFGYTSYVYKMTADNKCITINCPSRLFNHRFLDTNEIKNIDIDFDYLGFAELNYLKNYDCYIRRYIPDNIKYPNTYVLITYDKNLNYIGETVCNKQRFTPKYSNGYWYYFKVKKNKLILNQMELKWVETNVNQEKEKLNKVKQEALKKLENERCKIQPEKDNSSYQPQNILNYLKQFGLNNSKLCVTILHKEGCFSCNKEVLDFIKVNQSTLLNIKSFYVFYVNPGVTTNESLSFFEDNSINITNNCKIDTTQMYQFADPYSFNNPRLILIKDNKLIFDTIYLPDNLEKYFEKVVEFYNLTTE